jgi:hypothetical protein
MIPARLRNGAQWNDACILNISSRGLLVHSPRGVPQGSTIELRRGEHVIVARVVWRDGARVGLQADERMPVDQIISLDQAAALQLTAAANGLAERRKRRRAPTADSRLRGRAMEFVSVGVIAASLALTIWSMVDQALGRPMAAIAAALGE